MLLVTMAAHFANVPRTDRKVPYQSRAQGLFDPVYVYICTPRVRTTRKRSVLLAELVAPLISYLSLIVVYGGAYPTKSVKQIVIARGLLSRETSESPVYMDGPSPTIYNILSGNFLRGLPVISAP